MGLEQVNYLAERKKLKRQIIPEIPYLACVTVLVCSGGHCNHSCDIRSYHTKTLRIFYACCTHAPCMCSRAASSCSMSAIHCQLLCSYAACALLKTHACDFVQLSRHAQNKQCTHARSASITALCYSCSTHALPLPMCRVRLCLYVRLCLCLCLRLSCPDGLL